MTSSTELTGSGITAVVPKSPFARSWTTTTLVIQAFTELMWPQCRHGQTRLHSSQSGVVTQLPLHFVRKSVELLSLMLRVCVGNRPLPKLFDVNGSKKIRKELDSAFEAHLSE